MKHIFTRLMALCLMCCVGFVTNAQSTTVQFAYNSYGDGDNGSGTIAKSWQFSSHEMFSASVASKTDWEMRVGQDYVLTVEGENFPVTGWFSVAIVDNTEEAGWWTESSGFTGFWVNAGEPFHYEVPIEITKVTKTPSVWMSYAFNTYEDAQAFNDGVAMSENVWGVKPLDVDFTTINLSFIESYEAPTSFVLEYNNSGVDIDSDDVSDSWSASFKDFKRIKGFDYTPQVGDIFTINMEGLIDGISDGTFQVDIVDTRSKVNNCGKMSSGQSVTIENGKFSASFDMGIENILHESGEYYILPKLMITLNSDELKSTNEGFDNTKKYELVLNSYSLEYKRNILSEYFIDMAISYDPDVEKFITLSAFDTNGNKLDAKEVFVPIRYTGGNDVVTVTYAVVVPQNATLEALYVNESEYEPEYVNTIPTITVNGESEKKIEARFAKYTTITAANNGNVTNGWIYPTSQALYSGEQKFVAIVPYYCCEVENISIDGVGKITKDELLTINDLPEENNLTEYIATLEDFQKEIVRFYEFDGSYYTNDNYEISATINRKAYTYTIINDETYGLTNYAATQTLECDDPVVVCIQPKTGFAVDYVKVGKTTYNYGWFNRWISFDEVKEQYPVWYDKQSEDFKTRWESMSESEQNNSIFFIDSHVYEDQTIEIAYRTATFAISIDCDFVDGYVSPEYANQVPYGSDQTIAFFPRSNKEIKRIVVDGNDVEIADSYTFYNVTENHSISVEFGPIVRYYTIAATTSEHGTISPSTQTLASGSNVTFTFTPDENYVIKSIKVDGVEQLVSGNSYTFYNITTDHSIDVVFGLETFITQITLENATLISGSETVEKGSDVTYTFEPSEGCTLVDVLVDGESVGKVNSYTFTNVNEIHTLKVVCERPTFTITTDFGKNGFGYGESVEFAYGEDGFVIIQPNVGFEVDKIYIDGVVASKNSIFDEDHVPDNMDYDRLPEKFIDTMSSLNDEEYYYTRYFIIENVTEPHSVVVTYKTRMVTIYVEHDGEGSITPSVYEEMHVEYGSDQQFTIIPAEGYVVSKVYINDVVVDSLETYTFKNVTETSSIFVMFELETYNVTATASENGTVLPSTTSLKYEESQIFTFTPNEGYEVAYVLINGKNVGAVTSYELICPAQDTKVEVFFDKPGFTFVETVTGNGTISPEVARVLSGANQNFTFTANEGSYLVDVKINGESKGAIENYSFTNVQEVNTIEAIFAKYTLDVTATYNEYGIVIPSTTKVEYGDNQFLVFIPKYDYEVNSVTIDGIEEKIYTYEDLILNNITSEYEFDVWTDANKDLFGSELEYIYDFDAAMFYLIKNVTKAHTIEAIFGLPQFEITVANVEHGTISPATIKVNQGATQVFAINANNGYEIENVLVDGISVGAVASYTFENVTETHSISATFRQAKDAIDENTESSVVYANDHTIYVKNANDVVSVYNVSGQKIAQADAEYDTMEFPVKATGAYFVTIGTQSFSVIVK